ncbi:unnamed protein product, partial [Gulo gulo]
QVSGVPSRPGQGRAAWNWPGSSAEALRQPASFPPTQVMQVVREQITRALPSKPSSLDQFKSKLRSLSYSEILRLRQSERMSQDDFQSPPIVELREKIQPEILELIKQQRLNRLCEGSSFRKIGNRRRQERFWYCRLALNHKVLHYGDLDDNPQGEVTFESLQEKSRFIPHCCIIVAGLDVRRPEF